VVLLDLTSEQGGRLSGSPLSYILCLSSISQSLCRTLGRRERFCLNCLFFAAVPRQESPT
jgi:hypothetical protein